MTSAPPTRRRHAAGDPWVAAGLCLGLASLCCLPALLHPTTVAVGHPGADVWNHLWGYGWVADALAAGTLPTHTDALRWPVGGALWFIDASQAAALAPLTWAGGPVLSYNLAMVLGLALSAFGAWKLAAEVCEDGRAAAVAAVIYGAAPHLLAQAQNGISETVCAGWLPLTLWALLRLLRAPGLQATLILAAFGALTGLSSWYYGLFAAIAGLVILVASAPARQVWPWLGLAVILAGLAVSPSLWLFRESLNAPDGIVSRDPAFVESQLHYHNLTDLLAYLRPGRTPSPDLKSLFGEDLLIVIYVGWTGVILAGLGLAEARRRAAGLPWLALAAVFFVLSLGPWLYLGGQLVTLGGRRVPLPFLPLFDAIPIFARISHPFRFSLGVSLGLAVLAAAGLARVGRRAPWLFVAAPVLAFLEFALLSPVRLPLVCSDARVAAPIEALARAPEAGAVLDLPIALPNLERGVYSWEHRSHRRPVPWSLNEPVPALLAKNPLTAAILRVEASYASDPPPRTPDLEMALGARQLSAQGLAFVVLHRDLLTAAHADWIEAILLGVYGPPMTISDDSTRIYRATNSVALVAPDAAND